MTTITSIKQKLEGRAAELRPLVTELASIESALDALNGAHTTIARPRAIRRIRRKSREERAPRGQNRDAIINALKKRNMRIGELHKETGIKKETLSATTSQMKSKGIIKLDTHGRYSLTEVIS